MEDDIQPISALEHIRLRPGMYVGPGDFFGLIHYLVGGVNFLLNAQPTTLAIELAPDGVVLSADVQAPLAQETEGIVAPFERIQVPHHDLDAAILAALSQELEVKAVSNGQLWSILFRQGKRVALEIEPSADVPFVRLRAVPDPAIFSVTSISPYNFHSYLRRLSYLHPGVRFRFTIAGETTEYHSPAGLREMFTAITAPYQILHEPICLCGQEGDLNLELVLGFHSWSNDVLMTFINGGRAAEGGSHEEGLQRGLLAARAIWNAPTPTEDNRAANGIVALMAVSCPELTWYGCVKNKIDMPALVPRIEHLIARLAGEWLKGNPQSAAELHDLSIFHFPELLTR